MKLEVGSIAPAQCFQAVGFARHQMQVYGKMVKIASRRDEREASVTVGLEGFIETSRRSY